MSSTVRVCLWSGPRNVSTALLYSFAQRADTRALDEPLYGHYLRVSGAEHPGRDQCLDWMRPTGEAAVREVVLGPSDRPILFMKQMAHHLIALDWSFLAQTVNVLLIRDPEQMLPSLIHQVPEPKLLDTGLEMQTRLYEYLRDRGQDPPVLDSREVLLDPETVLRRLCDRIGIPFDRAMLRWEAGPKAVDGPWAPHWYHNLHRSTGFAPYREKSEPFPERLKPLLDECRPHYKRLYERAIRAR